MDSKIRLYPHNKEGYTKVKEAYNNGENVVGIVHATGTGKTYIALQLLLDNPSMKSLFVVPSNAIIEHIKESIEECGLSLERDFPNLQFCTYQALSFMTDEELSNLDIDMLVLDEFHHIGAPVWGEKVNTIVNTHPNMKVFGMTAYTVRDRGNTYERDMALSGGNELFSDKIVSTYDIYDAMCDGVLPIPNYKSAYLDLLEQVVRDEDEIIYSNNIEDYKKKELLSILKSCKEQIDKAPKSKDLIRENLKYNDKCIYFCPVNDSLILQGDEILGTNDVQDIRRRIGNLALQASDKTILYETTSDMGESGLLNRDHFYNDTSFFRNEDVSNILRIMFAKNQYNEGVHAPGVTKVFMGRQTKSDIVFFEQIGRALSVRGNIIELTNKYEGYTKEELEQEANKQGIDISKCNTKEEIIERLLAPTIIDLVGNIEYIRELKDNLKGRIRERKEKRIPTKITRELVEASFDISIENEDIYNILRGVEKNILISPKDLLEEYIEMLADDRIGEIKAAADITFNIGEKSLVRKAYWSEASFRIKSKLLEEKYQDSKYDKVRLKIDLFEKKSLLNSMMVEEYIEMLADDRIKEIVATDPITFNIDGMEVTRKKFWEKNKYKITERLESEKYQDSKYDNARNKVAFYNDRKNLNKYLIEQYIEMIASSKIDKLVARGTTTFNIDGHEIKRANFLSFNLEAIKKTLLEEKYQDSRYDIVKEKITSYEDKNKSIIRIDINILVEEYIEMLADDRIPEIIGDANIEFNIYNQIISRTSFWLANHNYEKVKIKLLEDKYNNPKYDKVREKIAAYEEKTDKSVSKDELIEEYIEMLADDRIKSIKSNDDVVFNIKDKTITRIAFYRTNNISKKVNDKLKEAKYLDSKYDKARQKIKEYQDRNTADYSVRNILLIEEYIEMLADDRINVIKACDDIVFNIDGAEEVRKHFWRVGQNASRVIELLASDKYKDSKYDKARQKVKDYQEKNTTDYSIGNDALIEEYIEMLADGRIPVIKSEKETIFIIDGKEYPRSNFWSHNYEKVKDKLKESKYQDSKYDIARAKIKDYEEKNSKVFTLGINEIIEEYIEMLADGRISQIKSSDDITFNIDGVEETRKHFWSNYLKKIIAKIKEEKYQDDKYVLARMKIETAQDLKTNYVDIVNLCNAYNIDSRKNKKYIERLSYSILKSILMYFIDNNINYIDSKGIIISDFFMSNIDFSNKYGISIQELVNKEKKR